MSARIDSTGQRFGLLTVTAKAERWRYWVVRCDCGTLKEARVDHLRNGKTISCGCEHKRRSSARSGNMHRANTTHGMNRTRVHNVWHGMRQRCLNPNNRFFAYYGGRGIAICARWERFENFLADMGEPGPSDTLDRIDNDGPYAPENCRWASRVVQMNNRRVCRYFEAFGETKTLSEWSRACGIGRTTLEQRLKAGETIEQAMQGGRRTNLEQIRACARQSSIVRKAATHCRRGHEFTPENTGQQECGRYCKACAALRSAAKRLAAHR